MAKKTKGRQKVDMVKMQNESNLQVTFSKRRSGLFKKASELCTLCGVEVAIIVFSPGHKVYSFGYPCVGSVVDKYLQTNPPLNNGTNHIVDAHRVAHIRELNKELIRVENLLEVERRRGEIVDQMEKENQSKNWWEAPIEELNLQQLEQLMKAMEDLKKNVESEMRKHLIDETNVSTYTQERSTFGRNDIFSNVRATGAGGFVPFGARASGPSEFSPFDGSKEIDFLARVNPNSRTSGTGAANVPNVSNPGHVRQFF